MLSLAYPASRAYPATRRFVHFSARAETAKDNMKIAVLGGSGNVGSRLAKKLVAAGNSIVLASRDPSNEKVIAALAGIKQSVPQGDATAAELDLASKGADVLLIATPGMSSVAEWEKVLGSFTSFSGVVLDATNPLTAWPGLDLSVDQNSTSATEDIQKVLPQAKVYKAFNTLGAELMSDPVINGKAIQMMYAGPKEDSQSVVEKVIKDVGFEPHWVGPQRAARNLESIAELWIHMAIKYGHGRSFAFEITKPE